MVQKYIIDKTDLHNLLTGEEIPLDQGSKARAFCIEIPGGMTNGEMIQALFPNSKFTKIGYGNIEFAVDGFVFELTDRWLNTPYKTERGKT